MPGHRRACGESGRRGVDCRVRVSGFGLVRERERLVGRYQVGAAADRRRGLVIPPQMGAGLRRPSPPSSRGAPRCADVGELFRSSATGTVKVLLQGGVRRARGRRLCIAWSVLVSAEPAQDATQDVFVAAWRKGVDFRSDDLARHLARMAHSRAIDIVRSERRRDHEDRPGAILGVRSCLTRDRPRQDFAFRDVVPSALAALPPPQRQAIELAFLS